MPGHSFLSWGKWKCCIWWYYFRKVQSSLMRLTWSFPAYHIFQDTCGSVKHHLNWSIAKPSSAAGRRLEQLPSYISTGGFYKAAEAIRGSQMSHLFLEKPPLWSRCGLCEDPLVIQCTHSAGNSFLAWQTVNDRLAVLNFDHLQFPYSPCSNWH